ncbi:iron-containing alcohol dehydrogenase [Burkholderia contaminans]|jgi:alcohol dehydrogenase class IV|uniref:iron-containing alcohol dehydrogenase n=1 Tax=Burkholderia cepacia complex TaxID=87882 RepID=UPI000F5891D4|nr:MULTISPECIES: iron-containing alcohol dehydrogenase [Burkholderia cepacia complex]MCA7881983.1 iron-containing alcohol dehydrogenase [Burkholderia contaminans]MCA8156650.1 iron-containing alcohol dehydrogenase [Burkholderia contaminans]MDA3671133.1 iron-containing alcohol dehydrogenase [Burkholderia cenocepacia]MDA3680755.1 iron-containing alcohol dehydrogenase [Burkholderia cenocepacia]MDA3688344.1 iron-containing alcohol dehydrogenase [Burkholderia cenocepacia]
MTTHHFQTVKHIVHGAGSLATLPDKLALLDTPVERIALITQPSMEALGIVDRVIESLNAKDVDVRIIRGVEPEPTIGNVETVFNEQIEPFAPQAILSIGGGSVLDAAKLFAVRLTNDEPLRNWLGIDLIKRPGVPMILVPTTAGTGSEVTPNAIVTLPDESLKVGIVSRHLLPQFVILDAELTLGLPKPITAATGMDAFVHALESYISTKANPISDMYAMESMRLIGANIVEAYENGQSLKAREAMMLGSMYGGLALTAAGTAAVHALAYPLGGMFNVTHGVANAMLLPHVMAFNLDAIEGRLSNVARALDLAAKADSDADAARKLIDKMEEWTVAVDIPQDLRKFGVSEEHLDALAVAASKVKRLLGNNPKTLALDDMKSIYRRLLP